MFLEGLILTERQVRKIHEDVRKELKGENEFWEKCYTLDSKMFNLKFIHKDRFVRKS